MRLSHLLLVLLILSSCQTQTEQAGQNRNGSKILFLAATVEGFTNIFVMNPDGTGRKALTDIVAAEGQVGWPSWSPDGKRILYTMYEDEMGNAYIINSDGGGRVPVPDRKDFQDTPCWSNDGTAVAYTTSDGGDGRNKIKVVRLDGSGHYVVEDKEHGLGYQNWSPVEPLFVLEFSQDGPPDIYTMSALDGSQRKQLTDDPKLDEWPAFSRDGKQIAWAKGVEGDKDIWVMNSDGTNKRKVTNDIAIGDAYPSFSPDASRLAFTSALEGKPTSIYIINIDGSGLRKIADGSNPVWSPF